MQQNIYDDAEFFANYGQMPRSQGGLAQAEEWPVLRALLPDLKDKRVLDLGCGYGWHCRYAREQQARSVVGVDLSEKMLERARTLTKDAGIQYRRMPMEAIDFEAGAFDVVVSSLALHYVKDLDAVCAKVHRCLAEGGVFAMSVEHPIYTARAEQTWCVDAAGERVHWPVDHYLEEGQRTTPWMGAEVIKVHRTAASTLNTLIDAGFRIARVEEAGVSRERIVQRPELRDERRRPMFLLVGAMRT